MVSMETSSPPTTTPSGLEDHLGYWLRRVSNAVSGEFARALQSKSASVAEWALLRELHGRGQAAPGELAEALGMTRGSVSKVVDKLEAKKWLREEVKEGDNRVRLLYLTREGRRNLPILASMADKNDARFFDSLNTDEKQMFQELLRKVAELNNIRSIPTE
jgi:DNA-binding MarR family transcriptional regulator